MENFDNSENKCKFDSVLWAKAVPLWGYYSQDVSMLKSIEMTMLPGEPQSIIHFRWHVVFIMYMVIGCLFSLTM